MIQLKTGAVYYTLTTTKLSTEDHIPYTAYGIAVVSGSESIDDKIDEIVDVSTDVSVVEEMVSKFNRFELPPVHFRDAVYDFICNG